MKTSKLNVLSKDVLNCNRCVDLGLIENSRKFLPDQYSKPNPILFFKDYTTNEELLANERMSDVISVWVIEKFKEAGLHTDDYVIFSTTLCTSVRSATSGARTACRKQCTNNIISIISQINPKIVACFGKSNNTISKIKVPYIQLPDIGSLTNAVCAKRFLLLLKQIVKDYNDKKD